MKTAFKAILISVFAITLFSCGGDNQPRVKRIPSCGDGPKDIEQYRASNFSEPVVLPNAKENDSTKIKAGYYNVDEVDAHIESKTLSSVNTGSLRNFQMYFNFRKGLSTQDQKDNNEVEFVGRMSCIDSYSRSFAGEEAINSFNFAAILEVNNTSCSKNTKCTQAVNLSDISQVEAGFYDNLYFKSKATPSEDKSDLADFSTLNDKGTSKPEILVYEENSGDRIQVVNRFETAKSIITVSTIYVRCFPSEESNAFKEIQKGGHSPEKLEELNQTLAQFKKTYELCLDKKSVFKGLNEDK